MAYRIDGRDASWDARGPAGRWLREQRLSSSRVMRDHPRVVFCNTARH